MLLLLLQQSGARPLSCLGSVHADVGEIGVHGRVDDTAVVPLFFQLPSLLERCSVCFTFQHFHSGKS